MKAQLKAVPHTQLRNHNVIEVTYNGQLLCTITGDDGPGIRIISKYVDDSSMAFTKLPAVLPGVLQLTFPDVGNN